MNRSRIFGALVLACMAGMSSYAQHRLANAERLLLQAATASPANSSATQKNGIHAGKKSSRRLGDWLRDHKDLSPDQQQKLLENDPNFRKLPKDRQAALKERLHKFNSLTPEQRERALQRMDFMANLSQDQRKQVREANQQLQGLPKDRRVMVHTALRHLRQMDAQQREEVLKSDRFRSTFSGQEQNILKQLSAINAPGESGGPTQQH